MDIRKIIKEEVNDFDWIRNVEVPKLINNYGEELDINTEEAQNNFAVEKNGYYVISTPKGQDEPETILAYGSLPYIKRVLNYLVDMGLGDDLDLYNGVLEYSKKHKDNVLDYIKYT